MFAMRTLVERNEIPINISPGQVHYESMLKSSYLQLMTFLTKIGSDTEKNPGKLRGLAVTFTPVKPHVRVDLENSQGLYITTTTTKSSYILRLLI